MFLFEILIIGIMLAQKRFVFTKEALVVGIGVGITAILTVVHNSALVIFVNILSMFMLIGVLLYPSAKALNYSVAFSFYNLFVAHFTFLKKLGDASEGNSPFAKVVKWLRIVFIPTGIILLFVLIYRASNPVFDGIALKIINKFEWMWLAIIEHVDVELMLVFFLGIFITDFLLLKTTERNLQRSADHASDKLVRKRKPLFRNTLSISLLREHRSSVFLLIVLNALILLINVLDVYWVWFNFEWEGDYLKQFVHEGTYLLIWSILISIVISLYIFRGNQNFYSKNLWLRRLTYAWLAQNAFLALSVGVRNIHYIHYYALAYKRIGVFFFLAATIIGIITVIIKVRDKRSAHYLMRHNFMSVYLLFVIMALFNWDIIISKYNFSHSDQSFVHYTFLSNMSDKALPYLQYDLEKLGAIDVDNSRFPNERSYMTSADYYLRIDRRVDEFLLEYPERHWTEWNLADQRAFNQLKE